MALVKAKTEPKSESQDGYLNVIYNFLTLKQIPEGYSVENLTRLSGAFRIIDGDLYKGSRNPKKVIFELKQRQEILDNFHIDQDSGLHKSYQDTSNDILEHFYWKSVAQDAKRFVRKCVHCQGGVSNRQEKWTKLELVTHGPFPTQSGELKQFITLEDLHTQFILGRVVSSQENQFAAQVGAFLFSSMCQFGFPKTCSCVSMSENIFQEVSRVFVSLSSHLQGKIQTDGKAIFKQ